MNPFFEPLNRRRHYTNSPRTWIPGELVTASMMNGLRDLFLEIEAGTAKFTVAQFLGKTTSDLTSLESTTDHGKIAFDKTLDKMMFSINGGDYAPFATYPEGVFDLTDGSTPALDASKAKVFRLSAGGDRTIGIPTNPLPGQPMIIRHLASGAARTLALNTGTGGFRFGTDITGLTQTASGKVDYIGTVYDATANKHDVVAYAKGY